MTQPNRLQPAHVGALARCLALAFVLPALAAGALDSPAAAGTRTLRGSDRLALPAATPAAAPGSPRYLATQIGGARGGKDEPRPLEPAEAPGRVNAGRAMLYSLLLPGLGQQYTGHPARARVSYVVEGALWGSYAAFRVQSSNQKDRYVEFAQRFGGVDAAGKSEEYWRTIANYQESEGDAGSANEFVRRQARAQYPDDRAAQQAYEQANGYFGNNAWDWQTADNLTRYNQLRGRSIDSKDRARYSVALALVHRVVSVIDAARLAHLANRAPADGQSGRPEPRGQFGMALSSESGRSIPLLTYQATF